MHRQSGLTLLEAIVVVFILALIVAVLLPSRGGGGSSKRGTCGANLKSLGSAVALYAAANQDHLPTADGTKTLWLSDLSIADTLQAIKISTGMTADSTRKIFYCPDNPSFNPDKMWDSDGIRITGYAWLNMRPDATHLPDLSKINRPNHATPPLTYHENFSTEPNPSASELAFDWIITPSPTSTNYTSVPRPGGATYSTSHMDKNGPAGANVLCFDGHVEWRTWNPTAATALPCDSATFWLPNP